MQKGSSPDSGGPAAPEPPAELRRRATRWKVTNFVVFQLVYAACVLGAARGLPWAGPLAGLVLLPINLLLATERRVELRLWCTAGLLGGAADSLLMHLGFIGFPEGTRLLPGTFLGEALAPLWIITLWVAVGTMLRSSLAWLGRLPRAVFLIAAISGPFSFWSGARLGATELPLGLASLSVLALEYALLVPWLLALSRRADRAAPSLEITQR